MESTIFQPIERENISIKIKNQIKSLIIDGKLKPGDFLPPERELTKLLNISRTSLREALNSLIGIGLLEVTQGKKIIVKSLIPSRVFSPLDYFLKEDIGNIFELIEVRKAIETWNTYFAAKRATPEDIARLEDNIKSMRRVVEEGNSAPIKEDADFHFAIARATHNKLLLHMMITMWDIFIEFFRKYYMNLKNENEILHQHSEIVEAIKEKDSNLARKRIYNHLDSVEHRIRELIELDKGSKERRD